jgi:hypothetical protein
MSSRLQEKERRREARHERERKLAAAGRRRAVRRALIAVAIGAAVVAIPIAVVIASRGGDTKPTAATAVADGGPFGQHYAGLVQRREAAGVPTMMETMSSRVHYHPLLKVYVNRRQVPVPANIGIDPTQDAMQMAGLHTHTPDGTIHVEGVSGATLGQFFQIWGVALSARQLGPYRARGENAVRMWVDGKPSTAFGRLKLADRQRIVISYGPSNAPPPPA